MQPVVEGQKKNEKTSKAITLPGLTIFGTSGVSHMEKLIGEIIYSMHDIPNAEVEVRFGRMVDRDSTVKTFASDDQRYVPPMPLYSMCAISDSDKAANRDYKFAATVSQPAFNLLNRALCASFTHNSERTQRKQPTFMSDVRFQHFQERVHILPDGTRVMLKGDSPIAAFRKEKLRIVDFYCPRHEFDFRIQSAIERPVELPDYDVKKSKMRIKNRLSMFIGSCRLDMTLVENRKWSRKNDCFMLQKETFEVECEYAFDGTAYQGGLQNNMRISAFPGVHFLDRIKSFWQNCEAVLDELSNFHAQSSAET
ncbi:hypothetical protein PCE1_002636 [Barthelona sp. PCE]